MDKHKMEMKKPPRRRHGIIIYSFYTIAGWIVLKEKVAATLAATGAKNLFRCFIGAF